MSGLLNTEWVQQADRTHHAAVQLAKSFDLSVNGVMFLNILRHGPMRMGEVAADTGVHVARASLVLFKMQERGLVRSSTPEDRRVSIYELTEKGRKLVDEINAKAVQP